MNIDEILNEVKQDQMGVTITLQNTGGYAAKFNVSYYDAQGIKHSDCYNGITAGVKKNIDIPAGSTRLCVNGKAATFIKSWSDIFTDTMYTPASVTYHVTGTSLITKWEKIGA